MAVKSLGTARSRDINVQMWEKKGVDRTRERVIIQNLSDGGGEKGYTVERSRLPKILHYGTS